jgi:hypothetical protein
MPLPRPVNDYERVVVANVEKYGWHCTSVSGNQRGFMPAFAYTVGLYRSYRQPEFIIFGLDPPVAHGILRILADAAAAGTMLPLDQPCEGLIENCACVFVEVPKNRFGDYVFSASWFYSGDDFPLYQVVWPDREGRYPWNESAVPDPRHPQPLLAPGLAT